MTKLHKEGMECTQESRIERIERMQFGTTEMIRELSVKFNDAMLPTDLHPGNGLINQVKELRKDVSDIKDAQKTFKIWVASGVFFISGIVGLIQWLIK